MKSANLLNAISNYISSNMAQSIYSMSQFSNVYGNSSNMISQSELSEENMKTGIVCGISRCSKKELEKEEKERCL